MDIRQLGYFVAVAEEGSVSRAAKRLNISQPPLTRQMALLEEQVGTQLLVRSSKGMRLTEAGKVFLADARSAIGLLRGMPERARNAGEGQTGLIDIAVQGSLMLDEVPELLARFRRDHPRISLSLHTMNKGEQIDALRQSRITVAFSRRGSDPPDIAREPFIEGQMMIALPANDPLASKKKIKLLELADKPFVLQTSGLRPAFSDVIFNLCLKAGFTPHVSQTVGDAITVVALVSVGFGVGFVPHSATHLRLRGVVYVPLADAPKGVAGLDCIYLRGNDSPALATFLHALKRRRDAEIDRKGEQPQILPQRVV